MAADLAFWRVVLQDAILRMEGAHGTHPGVRLLTSAAVMFEACAAADDVAVRVEAHFRRAQCACYQRDVSAVERWLKSGRFLRRSVPLESETEAQVLLLEAVVLRHLGSAGEASILTQHAWEFAPHEAKLRGDIANELGLFFAESRGEFFTAATWYRRAVEEFRSIPAPTLDVWRALAVAYGHAGIALQQVYGYADPEARRNFREAEALFVTTVREPGVRARYWYARARQAFLSWRVAHGIFLLCRALRQTLICWWQ